MVASLTMLDSSGDTTIVWDEDTEDKMMSVIEKKMKEGFVFYIVKPSRIPLMPSRQVRAKKLAEIKKAGAVVIRDEALEELFKSGNVAVAPAANENLVTVKKASDAREVAQGHSVGVRPQRGG